MKQPFGLLPIISRGWSKKRQHPTVVVNSKNECTNVFGARSVRSFVFLFSEKKNQKVFVWFLGKLLRCWGRVCLFVDDGSCHYGVIVGEFLSLHRMMFRLFYFSMYLPQVNLVGQCWKPARRALSNRVVLLLPSAKYRLRREFDSDGFFA
jgi:hypothetical protein